MVEKRVTDGTRIAQLLASELTGLETGPLADVDVVDATPDVTPSETGTLAFRIAHAGDRVGRVTVYPDEVRVRVDSPADGESIEHPVELPDGVERGRDGGIEVSIETGHAVKDATDAITELLTSD